MSALTDQRSGRAAPPVPGRARRTRWAAPADVARRERLYGVAAVAVPTVLAGLLCAYQLGTRSLWLDEAATVAIASQHGGAFGAALAHDGGNMLGYYALMHVLIGAFGSAQWLIRLPSVLAAVASVAALCVVSVRLFGSRVALTAGVIASVSLTFVYWGQDARGYALMVALIAWSFVALLALLDGERPRRGAWLAYVALVTSAVYVGLPAALVIPAQLVVLFWHRDRARALGSAVAVSAICCVPLAVLAASRGGNQLFWVPRPSPLSTKQVADSLASSGLQPNLYASTGDLLLGLTGLLLLAAAWKIWRALRDPDRRPQGRNAALALSWLVIPLALDLVVSLLGQSIFQPRYLLPSLPAVALLLAWVLLDRGLPRVVSFAAVTGLIALRALSLAPSYGVSTEPWHAATSYVLSRSQSGDCIAFYPADNRMPFDYYLTGPARAPRAILPSLPWGAVRPYVEDYASLSPGQVARAGATCARVWLVTSHGGMPTGPPQSRTNYQRLQGLSAALKRDYPRVSTTMFGAVPVSVSLFAR